MYLGRSKNNMPDGDTKPPVNPKLPPDDQDGKT